MTEISQPFSQWLIMRRNLMSRCVMLYYWLYDVSYILSTFKDPQ